MGATIAISRTLLAIVFVVSALAKVRDRDRVRQAAADLGVPSRLTALTATVLPLVEMALAISILTGATGQAAAIGALVLLMTFTLLVVRSLAAGRRPACHCFGQLGGGPIGAGTVGRNGVLVLLALVAAGSLKPGDDPLSRLVDASATTVALGALTVGLMTAVAVGVVLGLSLVRQNGRLLGRVDALEAALRLAQPLTGAAAPAGGLPVGAVAPDFTLEGVHGERTTLGSLLALGRPVVLVFSDAGCGPCTQLMPAIAGWQRDHAGLVTVAVVAAGDVDVTRAKAAEHGLANVLMQLDHEVASAYAYRGTPGAVLVSTDGTIGAPLASGPPAVQELVRVALIGTAPAAPRPAGADAGLPIGSPAPPVRLRDLDGLVIEPLDSLAESTLLVFWNPACGFCRQLLPQLLVWEDDRIATPGAPALLVVSTGSVDENRMLGFRAPVLLDVDGALTRAYGATGSPMAVLVATDATIGSALGVGGPGVMALTRATQQERAR